MRTEFTPEEMWNAYKAAMFEELNRAMEEVGIEEYFVNNVAEFDFLHPIDAIRDVLEVQKRGSTF